MAGVFQIDREIFENNIWQNPAEFRLFFYILGNAVWKEEGVKFGNVLVKRGQYLRSYRNLRNDLMYMEKNATKYYGIATIKRYIDKLVADKRIKKEETELGTLFTVVNYNKYQGFERFEIDSLEQQRNSNGTATEQQRNNKKKDNKDNKDKNTYKDICTEPEVSVPEKMPTEEIFISLLLNDKTEYEIEKNEIDTWKELYPAVNIEQELRNMKGWLMANPTKRKTKKGISRFVNGWLSREQDKGGNKNNGLYDKSNDRGKGKTEIYDYEKFFD